MATTGKVNKIKLTGDFSKFEFGDVMDILSDINPSDSGPGGTYTSSGSTTPPSGSTGTTTPPSGTEQSRTTGGEHDWFWWRTH